MKKVLLVIMSFFMIFAAAGVTGHTETAHASTTYFKYFIGSPETTDVRVDRCLWTEVTTNPNLQWCYYYSYSDFLADESLINQLYTFKKQAMLPPSPYVVSSTKGYSYSEGPRWSPVLWHKKKVYDVIIFEYETGTNKYVGRTVIPDAYTVFLPYVIWQ
jgi:hypothetical protein